MKKRGRNKKLWALITALIIILVVSISGIYLGPDIELSEREVGFSPDGVDYESINIETSYSSGDIIRGKVNISFDDAIANGIFSSNFEGNISLVDLLEENGFGEEVEFNCSSSGCEDNYEPQGEINEISVDGEEKIIGFDIVGQDVFPIESVSLGIDSNVGESCLFPQLFIDFLDDEEKVITSNKASGEKCSDEYTGCFEDADAGGEVIIDNRLLCENVSLPPAPSFELRANVKSDSINSDLKMFLYDTEDLGDYLAECDLPENTQTGVYETRGCRVNYSSAVQDDYFVCVRALNDNSDNRIKFDTQNACGTNSNSFGEQIADYDLSARAFEFGEIRDFDAAEAFSETHGLELAGYFGEYVSDIYGSDCGQGCSIPISFVGVNQNLAFDNIEIRYNSQQGSISSSKLYELEIEESKLSSSELEIDLKEAEFRIPAGSEEDKFELFFDGELVFEEEIDISKSFSFDVKPKFVAFGQNARFEAITNESIAGSRWDFGDGEIVSSSGKIVNHRYLEEGSFDLEVTLESTSGLVAKRLFVVKVGNAREIANATILDYRSRIGDLETDINSFPEWIKQALEREIDLTEVSSSLDQLEENYESANSDSDFEEVMLDLIDLRVPIEIKASSSSNNVPLLVGFENINSDYIKQISGSENIEDSVLRENIAGWMGSNYDAQMSFEQVSAFYEEGSDVFLSKFKVETKPSAQIENTAYLILDHNLISDGEFRSSVNAQSIGDRGTYITLKIGQENEIFEFYIIGDFSPQDLGAHISPEISQLGDLDNQITPCNFNSICEEGIGETRGNCPADCGPGRWPWFVLWIVLLIFIAFVAYVALQEWYKRYYERSLFKKKNDLYNLINFVYNARKSGLVDKEVKDRLKKASWKGEQVRYAFRKIDGKRTGMYEIPLFKFIENKKVKEELGRRQRGRVDPRFIRHGRKTYQRRT